MDLHPEGEEPARSPGDDPPPRPDLVPWRPPASFATFALALLTMALVMPACWLIDEGVSPDDGVWHVPSWASVLRYSGAAVGLTALIVIVIVERRATRTTFARRRLGFIHAAEILLAYAAIAFVFPYCGAVETM